MGNAAMAPCTELVLGEEAARFRPMAGKVLVLPDEPETVTPGGIIKPDTSIRRTQTGRVVRAGDKCREELTPGSCVFVSYWSAASLTLDDVEYLLYNEQDIGGFLVAE